MTRTTKREDDDRAERLHWHGFRTRLEAVNDMAGARALADDMPPVDAPGRRFHTNLLSFLDTLSIPNEASAAECGLYLQLAERLDHAGELEADTLERLRESFRSAPTVPP